MIKSNNSSDSIGISEIDPGNFYKSSFQLLYDGDDDFEELRMYLIFP